MGEPLVLIVNPIATRARAGLRVRVEETLRPLGLAEVVVTRHTGHASELARTAIAGGAGLVAVMGGDGTVNEVAQALAGSPVALAAIPVGSTNVFARAIGWPRRAVDALPALTDAIRASTVRELHLGRVVAGSVDRVFCVNAGLGADADTVELVETHPWVKTRLRHAGIAGATLVATAAAARRHVLVDVRIDGDASFTAGTLIAACGAPYAWVGRAPLDLVPGASFDGRLRWIAVRTARMAPTTAAGVRAIGRPRHLGRPGVADGWAEREIAITAPRPVALQADGEPLGAHTGIRMMPGPLLRAVVP